MTQEQSCRTCRFWMPRFAYDRDANAGWLRGQCRRHAPVCTADVSDRGAVWPKTAPVERCGDWEQVQADQLEDHYPGMK